jgi:branched-chain amino acid transport system substrate-binding protein
MNCILLFARFALVGAIAFWPLAASSQSTGQPIRLGELNSYKVFPAFLEPYKKGMDLAVAEINAAGGVLGRPIEIVSRDDNGNPGDACASRGAALARESGVADGNVRVERRPRGRRSRQAAESAVPRRRAAHRQDRLGVGQQVHVPAAGLDVHADGDARAGSGQSGEEALGDRVPELRVRPVRDGGVQAADDRAAVGRRRVHEQAVPLGKIDAGAVVQALLDDKPDAIFSSLFGPDLARFVREGELRGLFKGRPVFNLLGGEPEYLDPLKDEAPVGWWVTGYPWYAIETAEHQKFRDAYRAKFNDYPRLGSVVGYSAVKAAAAAIRQGGFHRHREARGRR